MKNRIFLAAVLLLVIYAGYLTWKLDRADKREVAALAAKQKADMEAEGWKHAATASAARLASIVPALEAQLAAAKKTGATIAGTSHWTGRGEPVAIPCTVDMGPLPSANPPGPDGTPPLASVEAPPTPSVEVTQHVKIEDAVAIDDAGGIYVARKVQGKFSIGESWVTAWQEIKPDPESTTAVDPRIAAAWKAHKNPPYRFEGFVGPSLGLDGVGIFGQVSGGRGWLGWFAAGDYVITDPSASRVMGGARIGKR